VRHRSYNCLSLINSHSDINSSESCTESADLKMFVPLLSYVFLCLFRYHIFSLFYFSYSFLSYIFVFIFCSPSCLSPYGLIYRSVCISFFLPSCVTLFSCLLFLRPVVCYFLSVHNTLRKATSHTSAAAAFEQDRIVV
jgi:hypothetical protein